MSNPQNPLAKFQTYAYHQILIICDSTETAEALATPTADLTRFLRQFNTTRFEPDNVNAVDPQDTDNGNFVVLLNGYTDAQFIITKATWTSLLAPEQSSVGGAELASMEFDGELEIIEPNGARFMKVVADATKSLNRDPVGLTWVLRTIFVGQLPNGQTETITNIKGVTFMVTDIEAQFSEAGAQYAIKFIGAVNGVGHLPAAQQITRGQALPVKKEMSVFTALKNYEAILNDHWLSEKERLKSQVADKNTILSLTNRTPLDINFDTDFARVEYKIDPASDFENFLVGTNEQITTQNTGDGDTVITPGEVISVEGMIKRILDSSKEIQELSKGTKDKDGKKKIYKILSGLTSTADLYTITYFVKLFEVPTTPFKDMFGANIEPLPGQFIEFNYIFTGKNTDILEFDMNMQMGLAFLQVIATTNNTPSQAEYVQQSTVNKTLPTNAVQRASTEPKRKTKTPLFLGMKLSDPLFRHKKEPVDTLSFQTVFGRWAGLENMEAKIKIAGNSQLLSDTTALPSELSADSTTQPREVRESGQSVFPGEDGQVAASQQVIRTEESTVAPAWTTRPVLMKINIKFPENSSLDGSLESFWWDGLYYLYSISHTFEDGLFTQNLEMFSIIQDDGFFGETDEDAKINSQVLTPDDDAEATFAAGGAFTTTSEEAAEVTLAPDVPSFQPAIDRFNAIQDFGNTERAAEEIRLEEIRRSRIANTIFPVGGGA